MSVCEEGGALGCCLVIGGGVWKMTQCGAGQSGGAGTFGLGRMVWCSGRNIWG